MKILQRYILKELLVPFVLCFSTLNFIFMAGYLVKAANFIIGRGVPLLDTAYVLVLALPEMISWSLPTSLLTAVLIVFGNLSQNNEIRAVKASGIYPMMIVVPACILGIAMSFLMLIFNDQITPRAAFILRKTTKQMVMKRPTALLEPGRFVKIGESIIFLTRELHGNKLKDIVAYEFEDKDKPIRTIVAERGEVIAGSEAQPMKIRLFDGSVSDSQEGGVQSIQFATYEFPVMGYEDIRKLQKKVKDLTFAEILLRLGTPDLSPPDRRELWSVFNGRIAFAFATFIFVFLGIPVAVLVHRGEIVLSFGISMACVTIYYGLFVGATTFSVEGVLPPLISYWVPNLLLVGLGTHLLKRAIVS